MSARKSANKKEKNSHHGLPDSKSSNSDAKRKAIYLCCSPSGHLLAVGYRRYRYRKNMYTFRFSPLNVLRASFRSATVIFQLEVSGIDCCRVDAWPVHEIKQGKSRSACFLGECSIAVGYDDGRVRVWSTKVSYGGHTPLPPNETIA